MKNITLEALLESGAHLGHQAKRWNPKMGKYLYGVRDGVHVFDLAKTKEALEEALDALKKAKKDGKVILFVGTKKQAKEKVEEVAKAVGMPYIVERYLGGTLSNFDQISKSIKGITELKDRFASGDFGDYTKKERLLIDRKIQKAEKIYGGILSMTKLPDMLFVVDTHKEAGAVKEANNHNIEVVGVTDSNADPDMVDYPIPMNDDASGAIEFVMDLVKEVLTSKTK